MIVKVTKAVASFVRDVFAGDIMDDRMRFSVAQALTHANTQNGGGGISTDTIDFGGDTQMPGRGTPLYINITVNTAFTGPAVGTFNVWLQDGATVGGQASLMKLVHNKLASAMATVGVTICRIPMPSQDIHRHLSLSYELGPQMTGSVDAWIGLAALTGADDTKQYGWNG